MSKPQHTTSLSPPESSPTTVDQKNKVIAVLAAILTTEEAAAYLQVKPTTLEQWRWNGKGPQFIKLGRCCRYRKADLEAFIEGRAFTSTTEAQAAA